MNDRMTAPTPHERAVEAAVAAGTAASRKEDGGFHGPDVVYAAAIQAYLAAMQAEGWELKPRQWTTKMVEASTAHRCVLAEDHWLHMYDAAPSPSPQREG